MPEGILRFDDDGHHAALYEYRFERYDVYYPQKMEIEPTRIRNIPLLDDKYIDTGYKLLTYWYHKGKLQCYYEDKKGNLFIKTFSI